MKNPPQVQAPIPRYLVPASFAAVALLTTIEWALVTQVPQLPEAYRSITRVMVATLLVTLIVCALLQWQRKVTIKASGMLAHHQALNERYQRKLLDKEAIEMTLSDQLHFLQILIDAIPAPIFYKNAKGVYTGCNRAFESFLGKDRKDIVGHSVYGVSPGPQAKVYHEKDLELMHQRGQQVYESQVVYADGTLHDVIFNKAAYELEDGRLGGLIGVILDITERKNLERKLIDAKEEAEFYSRSKTQFLTNMSHEIRTPLNAIVGFSQVLNQRSQDVDLPGDFHRFLDKIAISGQRLAELVNDVLDISRIEAGKIEAVDEDFNLSALIRCILVSCEPQASHQGITIHCVIDEKLPDTIRSDRGKISQILINLLSNAIKFSPPNSKIDLTLSNLQDANIEIAVADQGIGIPAEQQSSVFEPFEQVDKSSRGISRGTGLGLPITRSLVELLGGEITLQSAAEAGTTFRILLPLQEGEPAVCPRSEKAEASGSLGGIRVLIFEDNTLNQVLMQAFCDDLKIHAEFVADGRKGLEIAQQIQPDLIFMDVQLPGLSGIEATKKIRQNPVLCNTPIIGLSAAAFSEQKQAALEAGMNDYLTKPIAFPQLVATMQHHLR